MSFARGYGIPPSVCRAREPPRARRPVRPNRTATRLHSGLQSLHGGGSMFQMNMAYNELPDLETALKMILF